MSRTYKAGDRVAYLGYERRDKQGHGTVKVPIGAHGTVTGAENVWDGCVSVAFDGIRSTNPSGEFSARPEWLKPLYDGLERSSWSELADIWQPLKARV
jgi:hypothetical protein